MSPPVVLTIAGSDSGGGAGVQADLKTFAALGVFGTSALTALTAQNTTAVVAVQPVAAEFVVAQIDAVLSDLPVAAVKTGLLATAEVVDAVADHAVAGRLPNLVVDPVMVASSGARLLSVEAEREYLERLVPRAAVLTPNRREAAVLVGQPVVSLDDQRDAARALRAAGAETVVVTGGDTPGDPDEAVDVVCSADGIVELRSARVPTANTHGSGCSFASGIAAGLAVGKPAAAAIRDAKSFVHAAIAAAACWHLGSGHGPLNHFQWEEQR